MICAMVAGRWMLGKEPGRAGRARILYRPSCGDFDS